MYESLAIFSDIKIQLLFITRLKIEGWDLIYEPVVEKALRQIRQNPNVGTPHKIEGVHRFVIQRFPYLIFDAELEELIWIIAIAHGKRKPDYLKKRQIQ